MIHWNHQLFTFAALTLFAATAFAQTAAHPQFDAASVKVNESTDRASTRYDTGRVVLHKASLKHLVRRAYPVPDYQIVWPDWVGAQRGAIGYDVDVTFPPNTTPEQLELMFQDLLATRFGFKSHWEPRDTKVFEVRVSDRGLKLQPAQKPAPPTDYPKYSARAQNGEWHMTSKLGDAPSGLTIAGFLEEITTMNILDHPIVDATGVQGVYDIDLTAPADVPGNRPNPSELLNALDKELGLKATLKTLPLKMLIVDHLERTPTEN
jgi:uncharacterized protein (TIGR03435 family)